MKNATDTLAFDIAAVRQIMADTLAATRLKVMIGELNTVLFGGKMLRARLCIELGSATGAAHGELLASAAAAELAHAASLLHDDVIDGGVLRRSAPSLWVTKGVAGAVLLGDLMVCKAFALLNGAGAKRLSTMFLELVGEMCEAEAEQELLFRNRVPDWSTCMSIARSKTGSLFAFAGYACGGNDPRLSAALKESGYLAGTAYQLADDILDRHGNPALTDKTLGNDRTQSKVTAASAYRLDDVDPVDCMNRLCAESEALLSPWPLVRDSWHSYLQRHVFPAIENFVGGFAVKIAQ